MYICDLWWCPGRPLFRSKSYIKISSSLCSSRFCQVSTWAQSESEIMSHGFFEGFFCVFLRISPVTPNSGTPFSQASHTIPTLQGILLAQRLRSGNGAKNRGGRKESRVHDSVKRSFQKHCTIVIWPYTGFNRWRIIQNQSSLLCENQSWCSSVGANKNNTDGTRWIHIAFQVLNHFRFARQVAAEKGAAIATEVTKGWVRKAAGTSPTWDLLLAQSHPKGGGYHVYIYIYIYTYIIYTYIIFMSDFWMFQDLKYCVPAAGRCSTNHVCWNCVLCGLPGSSWGWLLKSFCCNHSWQSRHHNVLPEDVLWKACLTHCLVLQCCTLGYDL